MGSVWSHLGRTVSIAEGGPLVQYPTAPDLSSGVAARRRNHINQRVLCAVDPLGRTTYVYHCTLYIRRAERRHCQLLF